MNILITGSAGSLGYALSKSLLENDNIVVGIDNFNDYYPPEIKKKRNAELKKFINYHFFETDIVKNDFPEEIRDLKPKYFVHFASKDYYYELKKDVDYLPYINGNVVSTVKAFDFAAKLRVDKFIYSSTSSLYGTTKKKIFTEKDLIPKPISPQGASKLAAENTVEFMSQLHYIPAINFRISTVYGPNMRPYKLIPMIIYCLRENKPFDIYSSIKSKRDYLYMDDFVNFVANSFDKRITYQEMNLGSGRSNTIEEIATIAGAIMGVDPKPLMPEERNWDYENIVIQDIELDVSKAVKMLKYSPKTDIKDGLKTTIDWYMEHPDVLDLSVTI